MHNLKKYAFPVAAVVATAVTVACNTTQTNQGSPLPTPAAIANIEGQWRHAASEQMPAVCLTIGTVNDRQVVTQIDTGCVGTDQMINVGPIQRINNNVSIIISVGLDPNDPSKFNVYTYQLVTQSDGSMRGPASIEDGTTGAKMGAQTVVLVRV